MATRPKIPQHIFDHLMVINQHTSCICHIPRKHVQIHHIDGSPSNNSIENLAVLCLDCHSIVTGDEGLGRRYSQGEVTSYKRNWEKQCVLDKSIEDDNEEEGLIDSHYQDSILDADSHYRCDWDLEEDNRLSIWMESDNPIHVVFMKQKHYKRWLETGEIVSYEELYETIGVRNRVYSF